jgi:hypothetical protein
VDDRSTATTCLPAPTAYRSSVAVGDRETMRVGWALIVTGPAGVVTVSGNEVPPAGADADALPVAAVALTDGALADGALADGLLPGELLLPAEEHAARAAAEARVTKVATAHVVTARLVTARLVLQPGTGVFTGASSR